MVRSHHAWRVKELLHPLKKGNSTRFFLKEEVRKHFSGPRGGDHCEEQNSEKNKIQEVRFPPNRRLLSDGKPLGDHCSLSDYHIASGSTVQVMLCLRGGSKNERGSEKGKYCDHKNFLSDSEVGDPNNFSGSRSGDHIEEEKLDINT